jgi:hypothetical protein
VLFALSKNTKIVNTYFNISHVMEDIFHDFLWKIGGLFDSHWCLSVSKLSVGNNGRMMITLQDIQFQNGILTGRLQKRQEFTHHQVLGCGTLLPIVAAALSKKGRIFAINLIAGINTRLQAHGKHYHFQSQCNFGTGVKQILS